MDLKNQTQKRTIKFRIFNKKIKSYIDIHSSAIMIDELNDLNDNLIVEQFTGLHDKNGKEIYEGDILTVGENLTCEIIYIGNNSDDYGDEINCAFHAKVFIHNKLIPLDGYLKKYCEVIGNTYENQELLNN